MQLERKKGRINTIMMMEKAIENLNVFIRLLKLFIAYMFSYA